MTHEPLPAVDVWYGDFIQTTDREAIPLFGGAFVTGGYGLGENIVQGSIDPDEFYVHKPTYRKGFRTVLRRRLGAKQLRMTYASAPKGRTTTRNKPTSKADRGRFCISDRDVLTLAGFAIAIEDHYSLRAGRPTPMDIEWAKDGGNGEPYIVQVRPETVVSRRAAETLQTYAIKGTGPILVTGRAVSEKVATGSARVVASARDLAAFRPGEVLVADTTTPDWQPVMKTAAAIVTNRGGRTCHAAIVARELGVPAVVGAGDATSKLRTGAMLTVSCAEGDIGRVYEGAIPFEASAIDLNNLPKPKTEVMVNLGDPDLAFRTAMLPSAGAGLARMEFIIQDHIGIHSMALAEPTKVVAAKDRAAIAPGDRPALGFQDERIRSPHRRRRIRAQGNESDAGFPGCLALRSPGLCRWLRPRMRGPSPRAAARNGRLS